VEGDMKKDNLQYLGKKCFKAENNIYIGDDWWMNKWQMNKWQMNKWQIKKWQKNKWQMTND
jgi:hypothetical protein